MPTASTATASTSTGPRTTRLRYFEVGLDLLAEGGAPAVTVDALCSRLAVTKGSFYHHFRGVQDFTAELLLHWEDQYGHRLAREAMTTTRVGVMIRSLKTAAAYHTRHEAEAAIRALARSHPFAAEVQRRVDEGREDVLADTFVAAGVPPDTARTYARIGMAILIGTQQRERPVDRDRLFDQLDQYQRWVERSLAAR